MARNQEPENVDQVGSRPEEKVQEIANQDEFGEIDRGNGQRSQEQPENQVNRANNQEHADNRNQQQPLEGDNNQELAGRRMDPQANIHPNVPQDYSRANRGGNDAFGEHDSQANGGPYRGVAGNERGGFGGIYGNNQERQHGAGGYGRHHEHHGGFNAGPYAGAGGRQQNINRGPSLFDLIPRGEDYAREVPRPINLGQYLYPTPITSPFARAMSQITCNPTTANQGTVVDQKIVSRELFEQLQMALTVQLGLNGPQQVKERALHNVLASSAARADMKQILQSRAELYGDELDPKWFQQNVDLGKKAATIKARNQARSQLAGAPLLVAQVTELELRRKFQEGDNKLVQNIHLGT